MPEAAVEATAIDPFAGLDDILATAEAEEAHGKKSVSKVTVSEDADVSAMSKAPVPAFIKRIQEDRKASIAHTFLLSGNINDYVDTTGNGGNIDQLLTMSFDTNWLNARLKEQAKKQGVPFTPPAAPIQQVFAYYSIPAGLVFPDEDSRKLWESLIDDAYKGKPQAFREALKLPSADLPSVLQSLNYTFEASKILAEQNRSVSGGAVKKQFVFTIAFKDADMLFPHSSVSSMQPLSVLSVGHIRNWAADTAIGDKNTIILLAKQALDIHESIRSGDAGISSINIKRPNLDERQSWLRNFSTIIKSTRPFIGGMRQDHVLYAHDFTHKLFAINAAGMNLKQMEQIIRNSWRSGEAVDFPAISARKKEAVRDEFGGLIEFFEPTHGFEQIGGHQNLKDYALSKAIRPLQRGEASRATKGFLMTGPPGTAKTKFAKALAYEAKMNFILFNLGQLLGGVVGESESNMRKAVDAILAAAPGLVFIDELDSQSSGRQSAGDSGTGGRQFNSLLQFLADDSRLGRIVVVGATNRPDMLDAALRRPGRFDAIIPALPPASGDRKGRGEILKALATTYHIRWSEDIQASSKSKTDGLGKLLYDTAIWTGAEMEVVLKDALENALVRHEGLILNESGKSEEEQTAALVAFSEKPTIALEDWNSALEFIAPNTGEIEFQSDLALLYCNNMRYCPESWRARAKDKEALKASVQGHLLNGGQE